MNSSRTSVEPGNATPCNSDRDALHALFSLEDKGEEPRLLSMTASRWDILANFYTVVALTVAIFTGGFAVWEYLDRQGAARTERTLALVDLWESPYHRTAYTSLGDATVNFYHRVDKADLDFAQLSGTGAANLREHLYRNVLEDIDNRRHLDTITDFFTRLSFCVETDLCDTDVAKQFFAPKLIEFFNCYGRYISIQESVLTVKISSPVETLISRFALTSGPCIGERLTRLHID